MPKARFRAYRLSLTANDVKECLLRLLPLKGQLPPECLAPENSVPDVSGTIPPHMKPVSIRWGNGTKSEHFIYAERYLLRKNKSPIAKFFEDVGAAAGTELVIQQIGPFEFAVSELVKS